MGCFDYKRRSTSAVKVGNVEIGGSNPVRIQSMASRSTMATDECVAQCERMVEAGAELVRFTAQGVREAANLGEIRRRLRAEGIDTPLVADIHFNPRAAFAAATEVEKVRINPGNFVDPGRTFRKLEYTDEEYAAELERIDNALTPFLELCRENGTAVRIGVNHGSLSDRIMSRYGDTPAGMVESAMEFLRVCRKRDFRNVVISIKASNVCVMVETVRRLAAAMEAEQMDFPLHLGVTEAGDGDDGRVKSAVGIGTLLAEGLGDTIRVSLSEEPERELPVARQLVDYVGEMASAPLTGCKESLRKDFAVNRIKSRAIGSIGGENVPVVYGSSVSADLGPACDNVRITAIDASQPLDVWKKLGEDEVVLLTAHHANVSAQVLSTLTEVRRAGIDNPVIVRIPYGKLPADVLTLRASLDFGRILLEGFADGISIDSETVEAERADALAFAILQATRYRFTRPDYIACPSCGRTLFNLQEVLHRIKEATAHLNGVKIGVMGCIVNGPGEMADADFGYVGAGAGRVSLYKGKECVEKNIPAEEAVDRLVELIKREGRWK